MIKPRIQRESCNQVRLQQWLLKDKSYQDEERILVLFFKDQSREQFFSYTHISGWGEVGVDL